MTTESPGLALLLLLGLLALGGAWFTSRSTDDPTPVAVAAERDAPLAHRGRKITLAVDSDVDPSEKWELGTEVTEVLRSRFAELYKGVTVTASYAAGDNDAMPTFAVEFGEVPPDDEVRFLATNEGAIRFHLLAEGAPVMALGLDLEDERARMEAWRKEHPDGSPTLYVDAARGEGGPDPRVTWLRTYRSELGRRAKEWTPAIVETQAARRFGHLDFIRIARTQDAAGFPSILFELRSGRHADFRAFTTDASGERMAVVLGDTILTAPVVNGPLPGKGVISGHFTEREVRLLLACLQSDPLPCRLRVTGFE